jgi:hypothetical protein
MSRFPADLFGYLRKIFSGFPEILKLVVQKFITLGNFCELLRSHKVNLTEIFQFGLGRDKIILYLPGRPFDLFSQL